MSERVKVLIVEPSLILVEGLRKTLNQTENFNPLSSISDIQHLREHVSMVRPNIVILNPTLFPQVVKNFSFILENSSITWFALQYQYVESRILRLFHGVVDIREHPAHILQKLVEIHETTQQIAPLTDNYELSDRETDVLICLSQGCSSKEIADQLNISVHTVNSHRKNITRKTGIKSVAGLAVYATLNNLLER